MHGLDPESYKKRKQTKALENRLTNVDFIDVRLNE